MGEKEKVTFTSQAHVFTIDPETKKKWIPASTTAVKVAYYYDTERRTYRIISLVNRKALINSTITANMTFTKTSPKFGQWSDHRANTVYGLGFTSEKDLLEFGEKFEEAKTAARVLLEEKRKTSVEQGKPDSTPAAGTQGASPTPSGALSPLTPEKSPSGILSPSGKPPPPPPDSDVPTNDSKAEDDLDVTPKNVSITSLELEATDGGVGETKADSKKLTNGAPFSPSTEYSSSTMPKTPTDTSESQVEGLRFENSRLKVALASSAQNVKKWETEMQTLKNNNVQLTAALEESRQHVTEWKKQLQKYKEESEALRKKVSEMESSMKEKSYQSVEETDVLKKENEELKEVLSAVQLDLEAGTEELTKKNELLNQTKEQLKTATLSIQKLEGKNIELTQTVTQLEEQFKMAAVASKRKMDNVRTWHMDMEKKLQELAAFDV
ncbi:hypothetical protein EMCRGX_G022218 [Ephydatia muelleri]